MQTSIGEIQQTLGAAIAAHEAGNAAEAERLYRLVLQANPVQFDALQLLGLLKAQAGHRAEAEGLLRRALAVDAASPILHFNLGNVLNELGRIEEAIAYYDATLARDPSFSEAAIYRAVLLNHLDRAEDALNGLEAVLARGPNAEAFYNRANALRKLARNDEALGDYDRALALKPDFVEAWFNRGNLLLALQRPEDALDSYDRGLAAAPGNLDLLNNRGIALLALGRTDEALAAFDEVTVGAPDFADAHYNRGNALTKLMRFDEALSSYERALTLNPTYAAAANNRGNVLNALRRSDEAIASFDHAVECQPDYAEARYNRSQALIQAARYEQAIADLEWLLRRGGYDDLPGDLLYAKLHCCDWRDYEKSEAEIVAGVRAGKRICDPFNFLAISDSPADQLCCAEIHATHAFPAQAPLCKNTGRSGKIRLGYLSGEFREQATSFLLVELIERHDKSRFEAIGLDNGFDDNGPTRRRLNGAFDRIVDISAFSDDDAARLIADSGIDILINLNGYFGHGRSGVFARRPSPIQVNFLGFPGTIGASCIDYIIADPWVIPKADAPFYSENIVTLPECYQPNDTRRIVAGETPSRADMGLPDGAFVFCSFNNNYKLTPTVFDVWMRLLRAVDGSVLWLLEGNDAVARNLRREAAARGVSPDRLVFGARIPPAQYLARYRLADLFLDSLPYNAHTTASDALWMGLPVLTCTGTSFAGRVASSLLSALGLPELITGSLEGYEALALKLARQPATLAGIKAKLMRNRAIHPLFDIDRYRRHLEAAFETMLERHRKGLPPESFAVSPPH